MPTVNSTEYISIDGVPLSTPAWTTEDISTLLNGPGVRGSDLLNPARAGQIARRRTLEAREVSIPIVVNGYYDSDGNPHADPRSGLVANLTELKQVLTPRSTTLAGTRTLIWDNGSDIYRTAEVHVNPAIAVSAIGPHASRIVISLTIPGGALREGAGSTYVFHGIASGDTTETFTLTNYGNGQIEDAVIYFSGRATWGAANTITTIDEGAPTPGSGSTGDWYFDELTSQLYGPRGAGGDWPGPFEVQFFGSAPTDTNISRANYAVELVAGVPTNCYGPRTISNPDADSIKVENLTFDSAGAVYIEYPAAVADDLVVDCGNYSATLGATIVSGSVIVAGTPLWLPLLPGENEIRVTVPGNAVDASVNILYRSVYL